MTVSSTTSKSGPYTCNGSTSVFAYTFRILSDDHITVQVRNTSTGVLTTLVKTTDYTVSGVGSASGGNVTLVDAATDAPTGNTLIITRSVPQTQETDYAENDPFPAETHEAALDKLTMLVQQLAEQIDRCIKIDPTISTILTQILGTPSAGQIIKINAAGTGFETAAVTSIGAYIFPVGTGMLYQNTSGSSAILATLQGTTNEITITESPAGTFTFSLPSALTFTGKTITGGTFASPTISGTLTTSGTLTVSGTLSGGIYAISAFADSTDTTKRLHFDLSGLTTATTRNIVWQDVAGTVYVSNGTDVSVADGGTGASTASAARTNLDAEQTISGRALTAVTVATNDKIIIQDTSDSNNEKTVLASDVAALVTGKIKTVAVQTFTSSGTYTPTSGMAFAIAEVVGPGGGSGGVSGVLVGTSGGGGAGGYLKVLFTAAQIGASQSITIGTGGAAGTSGGGNGGNGSSATTIGSLVSAGAGSGSAGQASGSTTAVYPGGAGGTNTVTTGTTLLNVAGQNGGTGILVDSSHYPICGIGGSNPVGIGGHSNTNNTPGQAGTGYGAGASGPLMNTTAQAGGAGKDGYVQITEFIV